LQKRNFRKMAKKQLASYVFSFIIVVMLLNACQSNDPESSSLLTGRDTLSIQYIDILQTTHTDYGFTDHPLIAVDLHKRFLDIALDLSLESQDSIPEKRFKWTAEALDIVWLWWQEASESRRKDFLEMVRKGQIDVNAMPFHIQPFANKEQWKEMAEWVPEELYSKMGISVAMQNDVNGFARAGAISLLDKNIPYFIMGTNGAWGGSPFKVPAAFYWRMPDSRQLLVWAGFMYSEGYRFFFKKNWRLDQRDASNTQVFWPRQQDILATDESSMLEANKNCIARIKQMQDAGYSYDFIILSFTNQWRVDNDGPTDQLVPFVTKWNQMRLKPALFLTTASESMKKMEAKIKNKDIKVDTLEGEWQDWWAFGLAALPRELQAVRRASLYVKSSESSFWKNKSKEKTEEIKEINRMICRYYEHTFGANESTSNPYSLFTLGQINEKSSFAYRPLERAKWLLAQLTRETFTADDPGLYVVNTGDASYTGWVSLDRIGFRGVEYSSVKDVKTDLAVPVLNGTESQRLGFAPNTSGLLRPLLVSNALRFWVSDLPPNSSKSFVLQTGTVEAIMQSKAKPNLTFDKNGWVTSAQWEGMKYPLFTEGLADFMVLSLKDRDGGSYINYSDSSRVEKIKETTKESWARAKGKATLKETPYTITISQELRHDRMHNIIRTVEICKEFPRIMLKVELDRIGAVVGNPRPEIFYLKFPFPSASDEILATNGEIPYVPYRDHLPNSCKDFFVVDSWVKFDAQDGSRIWYSADVPLVNLGGHHYCARIKDKPQDSNELYAMLYNNSWAVNYADECSGAMTFEFEVVFDKDKKSVSEITKLVNTYLQPVPVMLNPKARENKFVNKYMNTLRVVKN